MKKFDNDIKRWTDYDFVVVNDNLEICFNEIKEIIQKKLQNKNIDFDRNKISEHVQSLLN